MDRRVAVGAVDGDGVGYAVRLLEGIDKKAAVGMEEGVLVVNMG